MRDYTMAVGDNQPYGFSANDDRSAALHALDYLATHEPGLRGAGVPLVLSGPDGLLSTPDEHTDAFCRRVQATHAVESTDNVRVADPTPPDCNMA